MLLSCASPSTPEVSVAHQALVTSFAENFEGMADLDQGNDFSWYTKGAYESYVVTDGAVQGAKSFALVDEPNVSFPGFQNRGGELFCAPSGSNKVDAFFAVRMDSGDTGWAMFALLQKAPTQYAVTMYVNADHTVIWGSSTAPGTLTTFATGTWYRVHLGWDRVADLITFEVDGGPSVAATWSASFPATSGTATVDCLGLAGSNRSFRTDDILIQVQ